MKHFLFLPLFVCNAVFSQQIVTGQTVDENTDRPIKGLAVSVRGSETVVLTDEKGRFGITVPAGRTAITVSGQGYETQVIGWAALPTEPLKVIMTLKTSNIEEITVNTGYQRIPKERATGAFSTVTQSQLNSLTTTGILERLPAIANGVALDNITNGTPQLMVRGLSTMQGPKTPLIVLDDFPYEGDLQNINPNTVESVSILKDAAASSIWGARAANGVIVITTKKAGKSRPLKAELTTSTTLSGKPDLSYIRQMSSADFIEVETELFNRGFYDNDIDAPHHPVLTPVIDLLSRAREGLITPEELNGQLQQLRKTDVRDEYRKFMYRPSLNLQYAVTVSEGKPEFSWLSGFGYDDNAGNVGEKYRRTNFNLQNTWRPSDRLALSAGVTYTATGTKTGRSAYGSAGINGNGRIPYLQFADAQGNPLIVFSGYNQRYKESVAGTGLVDWNYYPLTDWQHVVNSTSGKELILNTSLRYKIIKGLEADIKYQYLSNTVADNTLYDEDSYYTRNYINTFAERDGEGNLSFNVPAGAILDRLNGATSVNNIRTQLNYNYSSPGHSLSAIAGAESRSADTRYEQNRYYGYNERTQTSVDVDYTVRHPTFVTGDMDYIQNGRSMRELKTRFVSTYANAAYTYLNRYTVSGSIRRDASNLFGLKTNDQWNPFWSAGAAWLLSGEKFYHLSWLPELKLRGSYGFNGNIDPAMVAVTTIAYDSDPSIYTGTGMARIDRYYNPNLRWETVRMINIGTDFSARNRRISGSVDFFTKKGSNLFGTAPLDYTTGITTLLWNVAGMKGNGIDVKLITDNLAAGNFRWVTTLNLSTYRDRVTRYFMANSFAANFVYAGGTSVPISAVEGLPVYSVFAYRWAGLDPETGDPRGYLNGEISKDYSAITGSEKGVESLHYFGSAIPTSYGSLINTFSFKGFSLDIGITYKLGYWFRRNSINYTDLLINRNGHSDYAKRWRQPGDEAVTDVPSFDFTLDPSRDRFYSGSAALVEKGDHVRLQFLNLNYNLKKELWPRLPFSQMQLYCAANNLGILWRANKQQLDPDYSWGNSSLKPVTNYTFGLRANF